MNSMESSRVLFLFVLLFPVLVTSDVLDDVCSTTPFPDFCISTLRPDPRIYAAQGPVFIAVVMLDMVEINNQQVIANLKKLADQAKDPADKEALLIYASRYGTINNRFLPDARDAFISPTREGKAAAFPPLVSAAQTVDVCSEGIKQLGPDLSYKSDFAFKGTMICAFIAKSFIGG
ncbi:hypothetical protein MLD38_038794 [Melastoma candidum]|uniref:Uncharacterized protein n=1 Tax=Melastoma candidum TaxID=119954 RepID=A0ACB9L0V6_9MYRT|nr:hypothetical protein MLD38_038794 [Melastoma candidum]